MSPAVRCVVVVGLALVLWLAILAGPQVVRALAATVLLVGVAVLVSDRDPPDPPGVAP